jgi:hypothetical protein
MRKITLFKYERQKEIKKELEKNDAKIRKKKTKPGFSAVL